ncbi:dTDP-4-dehydrorhamnose 3,5-epimerase [Geopseudomonas aromaticivorans]
MKATRLEIHDLMVFEPSMFGDDRGFFFESFNQKTFEDAVGYRVSFVQDNHSHSLQGVLRGLHYQLPPHAQGKLVRVVQGVVYDVAVDIRKSSATFGKWCGVLLSAENKRQFWIPEGFAHGFVTLTDSADFLYKTTNYYAPQSERSIIWSDPDLAIDWHGINTPQLSAKDWQAALLKDAEVFA